MGGGGQGCFRIVWVRGGMEVYSCAMCALVLDDWYRRCAVHVVEAEAALGKRFGLVAIGMEPIVMQLKVSK